MIATPGQVAHRIGRVVVRRGSGRAEAQRGERPPVGTSLTDRLPGRYRPRYAPVTGADRRCAKQLLAARELAKFSSHSVACNSRTDLVVGRMVISRQLWPRAWALSGITFRQRQPRGSRLGPAPAVSLNREAVARPGRDVRLPLHQSDSLHPGRHKFERHESAGAVPLAIHAYRCRESDWSR